jgi:hypothetical protein
VSKHPKFIKFVWKNRERLWARVDDMKGNWYVATVDNKPISKGIRYGDTITIHKKKVIDSMN